MMLKMHVKKYLLSYLILVLGGYLLLVFAYCLPTDKISENVANAAQVFYDEGVDRRLNFGERIISDSRQDNFTDALMLLSAENTNNEGVFVEALKVERPTIAGPIPTDTLIALHTGTEPNTGTISYARYWHGYLVFLKPLLLFFDYPQIRYFLSLTQLGLVAAVICLLAASGKWLYCVPVVLAYFFLNPAVCSLSLQYNSMLVLTMAELVVILLRKERYAWDKRLWLYHFFLVGCLASYFDLLTYPVLTLGVPVIFLISQYEKSWKEGLRELFGCCLLWGIGYMAMWAGKWTLAAFITEENVWKDAVGAVFYRAGSGATELGVSVMEGRLGAIERNLAANEFSLNLILIMFAVCLVVSVCRRTFRFRDKYIPIALAGLLPFAWYFVVSNHSIIHFWMTFRALAISVYALMTIGVMLIEKEWPVPKKK